MNSEQARAKLNNVNRFTTGRSADIPIIISEMCDVVEFLLDKIERIKSPPMTSLKRSPYDLGDRLPPADPYVISPPPPDEPVRDYPSERGYQPKRRSGNAGDAK